MWTYQGIYRCKLCGKLFYGDVIHTDADSIPENTRVNSFAWHSYDCEDRCWGAGEAVGVRVVQTEQECWDD